MARPGISREQVYEVAGALQEEGAPPTVQAIRERLGSGSYTTINRRLEEWRAEHAAPAPAHVPDMPDKVMASFRHVWGTAARAAREDVETERQALEALRREMEEDKADMAVEIERLEKELEGAEQKAKGLEEQLEAERKGSARAQEQITALRIDNARLDERAKATEVRTEELRDQIEGLQEKLARQAPGAAKPEDSGRDEA